MQTVNLNHLKMFIDFAARELKLHSMPRIKFVGSSENKYDAFAHQQGGLIVVRVTDRHPLDVARSIAHEMQHFKRYILKMPLPNNAAEDDANKIAGRILRKFDIQNPGIFRDKANMGLHEETGIMAAPTNAMGASSSVPGTGSIDTFDPLMAFRRRREEFKNRKQFKSIENILRPVKNPE